MCPKFLALYLKHSLHGSPKRGAGADGKLLVLDGPLRLHSGLQGHNFLVGVVSDDVLAEAHYAKVQGIEVLEQKGFPPKSGQIRSNSLEIFTT